MDRAHEIGCTHWDSAALYGDSEELIGKWFQRTGKRGDVSTFPSIKLTLSSQRLVLLTDARQIFLATKFGNHVTPDGGREIRNDPEYIRSAVEESLSHLSTDYIDLLYWYVVSH